MRIPHGVTEHLHPLRWDVLSPLALYQEDNGTSFAAPHVAGAAAVVWGAFPELTNDEVRALLEATSEDLGDPGFDETYGHGRIDLLAPRTTSHCPPGTAPAG